MGQEFVSRGEHQAAIERLDRADAELRTSITAMERSLRVDYEGKIAAAVDSVREDVQTRVGFVREDVAAVDRHLSEQDERLSWMNRAAATAVLTVLSWLALHYGFRVG